MHAYAWYVWRKEPRSGPSLKVRVGKSETIAALSAVNLPKCAADGRDETFSNTVTPTDTPARALPSQSVAQDWRRACRLPPPQIHEKVVGKGAARLFDFYVDFSKALRPKVSSR